MHHQAITDQKSIELANIAVENLDYKNTYHFLVISHDGNDGIQFKENYRSASDAALRAYRLKRNFNASEVRVESFDEDIGNFVPYLIEK